MKNSVKTFTEFGFHPIEFNCIELARRPDWSGLLIDGTTRQVEDARALWPSRIELVQKFLTLDNLDFIRKKFPKVGVLSIDVDGNDFWFLKALASGPEQGPLMLVAAVDNFRYPPTSRPTRLRAKVEPHLSHLV